MFRSVFASLPRSRNPFEILKNFPSTSPASEMKTKAGNQIEEALNDRATEQAPFFNFTKPKSDSCCKKAVGSTSNDPVFNIPVAEESSFESVNERNKGKGAHFNKSLS